MNGNCYISLFSFLCVKWPGKKYQKKETCYMKVTVGQEGHDSLADA